MADPQLMTILDLVSIDLPGLSPSDTEMINSDEELKPGEYINDIGQRIIVPEVSTPKSKLTKVK